MALHGHMRHRCQCLRQRAHSDEGMNLAEVVVAMFLVGLVFASLAAVMTQSMSTMRFGGNFQTATQLANERIEKVRSLPIGDLQQGLARWQVLAAGQPLTYNGETLITTSLTAPTLTPMGNFETTEVRGSVTYQVRIYPTWCYQPPAALGTCVANPVGSVATNARFVRLTAVVNWQNPTNGGPSSTSQQTLVYAGLGAPPA